MADDTEAKFVPTGGEKAVILAFAVVGYLIGWAVRVRMGLVGAIPGAIAGGLGTGGGVIVGTMIVMAVRGRSR